MGRSFDGQPWRGSLKMRSKEESTSVKRGGQRKPESLKGRIKAAQSQQAASDQPNLTVSYGADDCQIVYIGDQITGVDDLVKSAGIDLTIWEVDRIDVNNWEVAGRRKTGVNASGKQKPEQIWKTGLRQIRIKLKRKAPKHIQDGIIDLLSKVPSWRGRLPTPKRIVNGADHMLEVSLYDAHFGKLCWGEETGTDYDLKIAVDDYLGAAEDLLDRVSGFKIEKIKLPIGHDLFHYDNPKKETANGTLVDSTDDRISKVFSGVVDAVSGLVLRLREIAEVEILWIPGNHDALTSFYLAFVLSKMFDGDSRVSVDYGPQLHKYRKYGVSLIGYDHGEKMPLDNLALLMATDVPDLFADSFCRMWRVGHFHAKKEVRFIGSDTRKGVNITVIPSLSGTDAWHYKNGYVNGQRAAEAALWNRETGYVGSFTVEARSAVAARKYKTKRQVQS